MLSAAAKPSFNSDLATTDRLSNGIDVKLVLPEHSAIAASLSEEALKWLQNDPTVLSVEIDTHRHFMSLYNDDVGDPTVIQITPYSIYQSQANLLTLQPGMKVCVVDSGIAGSTGETGGINNDFDWSNITGSNDSGTGNWFTDGGPHGTHVAGTVAAADNGFGVIGMAPGVSLHIVKVFNAAGWGYSSDLAKAATECTNAGADIITMSLGGGAANSTEENAFIKFTDNGGLVLAAAGNSGNNTRSYPAGYKSVMMIGGNDADNNKYTASQYPSCTNGDTNDGYCVEVSAGAVSVFSTYPSGGATVAGLTVDSVGYGASGMENSGSVSGATYHMGTAVTTDPNANGKICIIDRGNASFHDKVNNCENSGGIGAVIVNNVAGLLSGTLGTTNVTSIPAVGAAFEDRTNLVGSSSALINIGPGDYGYMSGTSMATPGVAGVAALVWSNHQACTGTQIRNALKASAEDAGTAGKDVDFGYGIVKAKDASDYITANGCDGSGGGGNNPPTASFIQNCTDLTCTFNASASSDPDGSIISYSWNFGDGNSDFGVALSYTFTSGGTYSVILTVTDNDGATGTTSETVTVSDGGIATWSSD
ncbi:MAG: S8 family serine peptidase, partial [Lentisphaeria bacterium]|nr:S8 family serine peptidase [Lentisphaeria bacterium]